MGKVITVKHKGSFKKTEAFFDRTLRRDYLRIIREYAERGVEALRNATPVESGRTADAWSYEIVPGKGIITLYFTNSNEDNGVNVAILLIYGHATKNGGYVQGYDFVTPAIRSVFQELADTIWREVTE